MNTRYGLYLSALAGSLFLCSGIAYAQAAAAAPAPEISGSFGGGLSLTSGNTDTKNFNLSFSHVHERKNGNTDKITALYLRGKQNKVLSVNRAAVGFRDEYKLSKRAFVFGESDYLSDHFKDISYLISPFGGLGYKLIENDRTKLQASGGAGGIWEKNSGVKVRKSGT